MKTEVYSRITGYYRPVQNWNDGKSREYKDRKVYNSAAALRNAPEAKKLTVSQQECSTHESDSAEKVILFTTTTCPNCRTAKMFLDRAGIAYSTIVADQEPEKARAMAIRTTPTLIVSRNGNEEKYSNLSDIRRYIDSLRDIWNLPAPGLWNSPVKRWFAGLFFLGKKSYPGGSWKDLSAEKNYSVKQSSYGHFPVFEKIKSDKKNISKKKEDFFDVWRLTYIAVSVIFHKKFIHIWT